MNSHTGSMLFGSKQQEYLANRSITQGIFIRTLPLYDEISYP